MSELFNYLSCEFCKNKIKKIPGSCVPRVPGVFCSSALKYGSQFNSLHLRGLIQWLESWSHQKSQLNDSLGENGYTSNSHNSHPSSNIMAVYLVLFSLSLAFSKENSEFISGLFWKVLIFCSEIIILAHC